MILRQQTLEDVDDLASILSDPTTMSFYPRPFTREEVRAWILRARESYGAHGFGLWAMVLEGTGAFVGQCGLTVQEIEGEKHVEAGWHVARRHWRNGYASEAGAACVQVGFDVFGLDHIVSLILPRNLPSAGVAKNVGMKVDRQVEYKGLRHDLWVIHRPASTG